MLRNLEEFDAIAETLEAMRTAILEPKFRTRHKIADRARHQYTVAFRHGCDAGRDVDGDAADILALELDLARMDAAADSTGRRVRRRGDLARASHGTRRAIEGGKEAVAQSLDFSSPKPGDFSSHDVVVPVEKSLPVAISHLGARRVESTMSVKSTVASTRSDSASLRAPVRNSSISSAGRSDVAGPDDVIGARKLDELGARDVLRQKATTLHIHPRIAGPMEHESRNADRREDVANIDLAVHSHQRDHRRRTCAQSFEARPPLLETLVCDLRRREGAQARAAPPRRIDLVQEGLEPIRRQNPGVEVRVGAIENQRLVRSG